MNSAFSKIWIIAILAVVAAGGVFVWQKFGAQKEEVKSLEIIQDETAQKEAEYIENNYLQVTLKSVTDYPRADKNNYVRTKGKIVGLEYDNFGGSILLSDNSNNYLLVAICHACVEQFSCILSALGRGDEIEVAGSPSFTNTKEAGLAGRFHLQQELPEIIGMLSPDFIWKTDGSTKKQCPRG